MQTSRANVSCCAVDLNLPVENGRVTDATRLERILPTMRMIADSGGKLVLLSHFGARKGVMKPIRCGLSRFRSVSISAGP